VSDVGAVGGQLGHSHTGGAGHQHQAIAGHTHTQSLNGAGTPDNAVTVVAYTANWMARSGHTHGGTVTTGTDFGTQSNTAAPGAAAVADGRPPYLEVAIIQFGGPPTCAITSPTAGAVLATPSPPVTWTLTGSRTQQDYQLQVYAADGSTVVYDSGRVVSTVLSAQVAPGFLRTGQTYLFRVIVNTTLSENAISPTVQVTTSWTAVPPITPVTVTPVGGT